MDNKVEKYKITPEMRLFTRYYKRINKIGELLTNKLKFKLSEADQLRQALSQVEQQRQALFDAAPKNPTYDLEGQE